MRRLEHIQELVEEIVRLRGRRREAFIASVDPEIADEVRSIVRYYEDTSTSILDGSLLDREGIEKSLDAAAASLADGSVVDVFQIESFAGHGGMGEVYRATRIDGIIDQTVALKVIRRHDPELIGRFERERQIIADFDHPNIGRCFDAGALDDGRPFLVMDYIDGVPVDKYVSKNNASRAERLEIFYQVCHAIEYAHRQTIVHCDLKPGNILVTPEGKVKLLDFGIAGAMSSNQNGAPDEDVRATLMYAAPEQTRGERPTVETDVYSLGVVLYELLIERSPYRETAKAALLKEVREGVVASPETGSRDLDRVILKALAKDRDERYPDVRSFREDVERALTWRPVTAVNPSAGYRLSLWLRRNRYVVTGGSTVLLVVLSLLFAVQRQRQQADRSLELSLQMLQGLDPEGSDKLSISSSEMLSEGTALARDRLGGSSLARYLSQAGKVYRNLGLHDLALATHKDALELVKRAPASAATMLAKVHFDAAESARHAGLAHMADSLLGVTGLYLSDNAESDGVNQATWAASRAAVYRLQGQRDDAMGWIHRANSFLAAREHVIWDRYHVKQIHAGVLRDVGRLEESQQMFEDLVGELQSGGMGADIEAAANLNNLAVIVHDRWRAGQVGDRELVRADSILDVAISISRQRARQGHPALANALNSKGDVLVDLNRTEEAVSVLREASRVYRDFIDAQHHRLPRVLSNLAIALERDGRAIEARKAYEDALSISDERFGPGSTQSAFIHYQIAILLEDLDPVAGIEHGRAAVDSYASTSHGNLDVSEIQLIRNLLELEDTSAVSVASRLYARRLTRYGPDDWHTANAESYLGAALAVSSDTTGSARLLTGGYEKLLADFGPDHSRTISARERLEHYGSG